MEESAPNQPIDCKMDEEARIAGAGIIDRTIWTDNLDCFDSWLTQNKQGAAQFKLSLLFAAIFFLWTLYIVYSAETANRSILEILVPIVNKMKHNPLPERERPMEEMYKLTTAKAQL